jgi:hypothetical protein
MRTSTMAGFFALLAAACGGGSEAEQGAPSPATSGGEAAEAEGRQRMSMACPVEVEGTTVQAENVEGGVSMVFLTTGDVGDMRERVRHFAALEEARSMRDASERDSTAAQRRSGQGEAASAKAASPTEEAEEDGAETAPRVNSRVEDIEGGARMVLIPMDSSDLEAVRMHVEEQAQTMAGGRCPPMPVR